MKSGEPSEPPTFTSELFTLHPALDTLSTFIYVKDRDLRIVSVNRSYCEALGVAREDLIGKPTEPLLGEDGPASTRVDREVIESGTPRRGIVERLVATDGLHWVATDKSPIRGPDGTVIGLIGTSVDITAQRDADERLRQSESQLRFLTEHMADILWTMDLQFHTTFVTSSITRVLGFTPEERRLQSLQEMVTPETAGRILTELQRQLQFEASGSAERDRTLTIDVEYYRKDGSTAWMETLIQAVRDEAGTLVGMVGVSRDITERKRATDALRESDEKYRALFGQSLAPISLISPEGRVLEANPAWLKMFGYSEDDLRTLNVRAQYRDPNARERFLDALLKEGRLVDNETRLRRKDGTEVDILRSVTVRRKPNGDIIGFQNVFRDITAEKAAEQALRQSEEKYRQIVYQSIVPISLVSLDGRIIEVNDAWLDLHGYTREDVPSFNAASLFDKPEDRHAFVEHVLRSGHLDNYESHIRRRDGTCIDVLRSISVRYNPDGSILGFQTIMRDVTELNRTRDELLSSREQLRHLALRIQDAREEERTSIARELHDQFGQGLTALRLDLESLTKSRPPSGDSGLVRIRSIMQLVDQMSQELRRVISAARPGMLDDLGLCAALEWQAGQFSERTGIATNLILTADDAALSPSVSTALFRTFQELLSNVERHARATYVDVSLVSDRDSVYLAVVDNGRGITDDELHSPASLGILGVQERIRSCGGTVTFHGEPGKGTTVTVTVPLHTDTADGWQVRLGLH